MFGRILMAKAGEGSGSGSGGGAPPPADDDDDDAAAAAALDAKINKIAHAAIGAKTKALDAKAAALDAALEKLTALIAATEAKAKEPKEEPAGAGGKPATDPAAEARIRAAEKQAAESARQAADATKAIAEWKAKAEATEKKMRDDAARATLLEQFIGGGVPRELAVHVVKSTFDRVGYDDDDTGGKGQGKPHWKDADGDPIEIALGVKAYLKTDEGKALIPARGAGGSGKGAPAAGPVGARDKDGNVSPLSDADLNNLVLSPRG